MSKIMKEENIPLWALESGDPVKEFDFFAITVQYEGLYTNILYLLELAGMPFYAKDRDDSYPIVLGGGHSIGVPIAVAADHTLIAPSATMTIHPVRLTGMVIGVPATMEYLENSFL